MSSVAPAPIHATVAEIRARTRRAVKVYSPSEETETVSVYGDDYRFPPNSVLEIHDKLRYKTIRDLNPRSASDAVAWHDKNAPPRERAADVMLGAEAAQIAAEMCEQRALKGFVTLLNDDLDQERMLAGRRRYLDWRLQDASGRHQALVARVTAYQRDRPGTGYPIIRRSESEALKFLERYNRGEYAAYLDVRVSSQEDIARLVALTPGLKPPAEVELPTGIPVPPAELVADPTPTPPPPPAEVVGALLLKKARRAKVYLTRAELEGLLDENVAVIAAVAKKIGTADPKEAQHGS